MRFATACSGIGVADLAAHNLGWTSEFACEIEAFPRAVLAERFGFGVGNGAKLLEDMNAIDPADWPAVECFIAGTPCQAFSISGMRRGMKDPRGQLTLKFVELLHAWQDQTREGRAARPFQCGVWENVPGVLSDKGNAFGNFLSALVGGDNSLLPPGGGSWPSAGMVSGPRARAAWRIFDAQYFGAPQRRRRVFLVVSFGDIDPAKVLFEQRRLQRDIEKGAEAEGRYSTGFEIGPSGGREADVAPTLDAGEKDGPVRNQIGACVLHGGIPDVANGLVARMGKGVDSTLKNQTLIAFSANNDGSDSSNDLSPVLRAGNAKGRPNGGVVPAVAFAENQRGEVRTSDTAPPLQSGGGKAGQGYSAVCYDLRGRENGSQFEGPHDTANMRAASGGSSRSYLLESAENYRVRKLTPRECERLQSMPDDWTLLSSWNKKRPGYKKDLEETAAWIMAGNDDMSLGEARALAAHPDGPRYKALGNAWNYNVGYWVLRRVHQEYIRVTTTANSNNI